MRVELMNNGIDWQLIKNITMGTIGKEKGVAPDSLWKTRLLKSAHSPIRAGWLTIRIHDLPYWISVHLVRHKIGIEHWVSTQRDDRTKMDIPRAEAPQGALVMHTFQLNIESLITISRKRLCGGASKETQEMWLMVLDAIKEQEPEIVELCVPRCVHEKACNEFFSCGYKAEWFERKKAEVR